MKRGPQERTRFETAWMRRDPEAQVMFNRIDKWLARPDVKGQVTHRYYDSIVRQWLSFACITDRQKEVLVNIIERWSIP